MQTKNEKILNYFSLLKKQDRISSSYIFSKAGLDVALEIVKLINCKNSLTFCGICDDCLRFDNRTHPDLFLIDTKDSTIKIDQIKELRKFFSTKSFQSIKKVALINNAHLMGLDGANSFLKTLEEPPKEAFIGLISTRLDLIIPTINSRCRKIYFPAEDSFIMEKDEVLNVLNQPTIYFKNRDHLSLVILSLITVFRDYIVYKISSDTNQLINTGNYEIIPTLSYSLDQAKGVLDRLLDIYKAVDNVNLNLAANLIKLSLN